MTNCTVTREEMKALVNAYAAALTDHYAVAEAHEAVRSALAALYDERDALERELDEASPKRNCDRCGKTFRMHQLIYEEGDELECYECNVRENARERAALATRQERT